MKFERIAVAALLVFFLSSGLYYAFTNSITSDELTHITTGYINLRFNDYHFNIEHPPLVKQLAALPLIFLQPNFPFAVYQAATKPDDIINIQNAFLFKSGNNLDLMLLVSRIPNILVSLMLGIFIYLYSKKLNGYFAGLISLILFVFSPSFLGHSPLVTMDVAISCFYFITIYFLMRFIETKRNSFLVLTGIFFGLSLISKFSALVLIPVLYVLFTIFIFFSKNEELSKIRLKNFLFLLPVLPFACSYKSSFKFIVPALIMFLFSMIFYKYNGWLKKIKILSAILSIVLTIAFFFIIMDYTDFKWFPLHGATKAYFKGFSSFEGHAKGGQGESYLLGHYYKDSGRWYYFPLAFIFKEPFAFLIILLIGLYSLFVKKEDIMSRSLLFVPLLGYMFVAMFINKVNIGIRHILPIYPFLFVIAGYSVLLAKKAVQIRYALILLLILSVTDVALAYPAHISYFNSAIGGIDSGYKFLGDSNVGWGQDSKRLQNYLDGEKREGIPVKLVFYGAEGALTAKEKNIPEKGIYVIETKALCSGSIKWVEKIHPTSRIGGSFFVYDITDKTTDSLRTN